MTINEARKAQLESIKNRSLKEKLSFLWEYYGLKTIALVIAVAVLIAFIVNIATKKDFAFTGVFFGCQATESADGYLKAFGESAGIDLTQYDVTVQCKPDIQMDQQITQEIYTYMESFTALVAAESVDCFAGNASLFLYYAYMGYATDLSTVLTPEELTALSPHLRYMDASLFARQEDETGDLVQDYSQHPDPARPELMGEPVPVAISLDGATDAFKESYGFGENILIGICANTAYPENALAFLRYCLGK